MTGQKKEYSPGPHWIEPGARGSVRPVMSWWQRTSLILIGIGFFSLLTTAALLRPDPRGLGTHQQLGFPPCTFQVLFDARCPSCGMTTAWSELMHGRIDRALRANVGGVLLACLALTSGPWVLASGILGRWYPVRPNEWIMFGISAAILLVTLIDWASRVIFALGR